MIKLVICDMDGTLLNDDKKLPVHFDSVVSQLKDVGIKFGIGSGRQFQSLSSLFEKHAKDFVFISDNGTFVYDGHTLVASNTMSESDTKVVIERLSPYDVPLIMSGQEGAHQLYFEDSKINEELAHYYSKKIEHDSYDEVNDLIGKVAVLDFSENLPIADLFDDMNDVTIVRSGPIWWDVMSTTVNKGESLKQYMAYHDIKPSEVIVFGDYMNDYEMLAVVDYSFAMENAVTEIKEIANFMAPSNNDEGVMKVLNDLLDGTFEDKWKL